MTETRPMRTAFLFAPDYLYADRMREQLRRSIDPFDDYLWITSAELASRHRPNPHDKVFVPHTEELGPNAHRWYGLLFSGLPINRLNEQTVDFRWDYEDVPDLSVRTDVEAWLAS